jgi:hypothetical protein
MVDVAEVEGGIRIGKKVFLAHSDVTTKFRKVNLRSRWVVTLPWWLLSSLQDRVEQRAPAMLKPFWRIGWSHTRAGFCRSSFTSRERDDGSVNGHHNLWVIHLCDLAFLFPLMDRSDQEDLAARLGKNEQQRWQLDFISADMTQSKLDRADQEALKESDGSKWLGMPVCSRLDLPWRSISTWHEPGPSIAPVRRHPNPRDKVQTETLRFQRRWINDLQRSTNYQEWLSDYGTNEHTGSNPVPDTGPSPTVDLPRVGKTFQRNKRSGNGSQPEFI